MEHGKKIKKGLIFFLFILSLLLMSCDKIKQESLNYLSETVVKANVKIEVTSTSGQIRGNGSGTIITESQGYYYVITNHHVVYPDSDNTFNYKIIDIDNNDYVATITDISLEKDLAILRFSKINSLEVVKISSKTLKEGNTVFTISNPEGKRNIITTGKISSISIVNETKGKFIFHTAPISKGSSGSMLLNEDGKLIGLNTWVTDQGSEEKELSIAISLDTIKEFIEKEAAFA